LVVGFYNNLGRVHTKSFELTSSGLLDDRRTSVTTASFSRCAIMHIFMVVLGY